MSWGVKVNPDCPEERDDDDDEAVDEAEDGAEGEGEDDEEKADRDEDEERKIAWFIFVLSLSRTLALIHARADARFCHVTASAPYVYSTYSYTYGLVVADPGVTRVAIEVKYSFLKRAIYKIIIKSFELCDCLCRMMTNLDR